MSKGARRRPGQSKAPRAGVPPIPVAAAESQTVRARLRAGKKFVLAALGGSLGLVLLGIWSNYLQISSASFWPTAPELHVQTSTTLDPFSIHFSARNPSANFDNQRVSFSCVPGPVRTSVAIMSNLELSNGDSVPKTIEPGATAQFTCAFRMFPFVGADAHIESATVEAVVRYRTLGVAREPVRQKFSWDPKAQQWIDGEIVD
jgi:hypothetical protein